MERVALAENAHKRTRIAWLQNWLTMCFSYPINNTFSFVQTVKQWLFIISKIPYRNIVLTKFEILNYKSYVFVMPYKMTRPESVTGTKLLKFLTQYSWKLFLRIIALKYFYTRWLVLGATHISLYLRWNRQFVMILCPNYITQCIFYECVIFCLVQNIKKLVYIGNFLIEHFKTHIEFYRKL